MITDDAKPALRENLGTRGHLMAFFFFFWLCFCVVGFLVVFFSARHLSPLNWQEIGNAQWLSLHIAGIAMVFKVPHGSREFLMSRSFG